MKTLLKSEHLRGFAKIEHYCLSVFLNHIFLFDAFHTAQKMQLSIFFSCVYSLSPLPNICTAVFPFIEIYVQSWSRVTFPRFTFFLLNVKIFLFIFSISSMSRLKYSFWHGCGRWGGGRGNPLVSMSQEWMELEVVCFSGNCYLTVRCCTFF